MDNKTLIYESANSRLFLLEDGESASRLVLKEQKRTNKSIHKLVHIYELLKQVEVPGIAQTISYDYTGATPHVVFKFVEGESLHNLLSKGALSLEQFFNIAISICGSLSVLHQLGILHKDINPNNIIWDAATAQATLIDFDGATSIKQAQRQLNDPGKLEGTLAYISPEQTGRINREVDFRSDLYSLGATFYELLSGVTPFDFEDPAAMIYAQIAKTPPPLHAHKAQLPTALVKLVAKLLEKEAAKRYQSAKGLKYDLECIQTALNIAGSPDAEIDIVLGSRDFSDTLQFAQKLYGRSFAVQQLQEQLGLARSGQTRLVVIEGGSGTGKSSLVNELNKSFLECNCLFTKGKFDQYRRDTPYLAWIQVFEHFIAQVLSSSDANLNRWKNILNEALGENGQVLSALIPSLQLVTGRAPSVEKLGGIEAQVRFNFLLEAFLVAICRPEHPLVIFLDDLQWADPASQQILQLIVDNKNLKHLLLITAIRPPEEDHSGSIQLFGQGLNTNEVLYLKLADLNKQEVGEWLRDTLTPCSPETLDQLGALVYSKTLGNAFFTRRFVQSLYDQGLLYFDHQAELWAIKESEIAKTQMTDNVVKFMTQKIVELDPESVNALKKAAVIGNEFDGTLLQHLLGDAVDLDYVLQLPLREGFIEIFPQLETPRYAFVHDRIYQAVSEMNEAEEQVKINYEIVLRLLSDIPEEEWQEKAFLLATHLNQARPLLHHPDHLRALIQVNLLAGKRAKSANAYAQAIQFLEIGLAEHTRLGQHSENLEFSFLCELLETYYLDGQFEQGEQCVAKLRALSLNRAQQRQALQLEIRLHKAKIDFPAAIRTGIEALNLLGVKLPQNPGQFDILRSFMSTQLGLRKKSPEHILKQAKIQDVDKLAALQIMSELGLAAYQSKQNLLPVMTLKAVQLAATFGNSEYSPADYNVYGFILSQMGNFKSMQAYALMSLQLVDQVEISTSMRAKHLMTYNGLTRHWYEHPTKTLSSLLHGHQLGRASGDLDVVVTSLLLYYDTALLTGQNLEELAEFVREGQRLCQQLGQKLGDQYFNWSIKYVDTLLSASTHFDFNFEEETEAFVSTNDSNGLCKLAILSSFHHYLCGRYEEGIAMLQKLQRFPLSLKGLQISAWLPFFQGLLAAEVLEKDPQNKAARREFKLATQPLKRYNAFNPDNFGHRKLTLDGLELWVKGKKYEAIQVLRKANEGAIEQEFHLDQALISWKIARSYAQLGENDQANTWAKAAYHLFASRNHHLATQQIAQDFAIQSFEKEPGSTKSSTQIADSSRLDLNTVIKSLQTISAEVVFDNLVQKLLDFVAENAGADKGVLFLDKNPEWLAAHDPGRKILELLPLQDIDQHQDKLAVQIVQYCLRTGESIILETAHRNEQFASDPYLLQQQPNSLLSIPLKTQGKVMGLLYLENTLVEGAFKNERSELLRLLASQLAISVENAFLYENLEHLIQLRTQQLEHEKQQSERLLLNILPLEVANELKAKGSAEATQYDSVSVLFTDFINFTQVSEQLKPKDLVGKLDTCFRAFDEIIERHGLEKIKTVGDAYIAVCGLPIADPEHAVKTVRAAQDIRLFIQDFNQRENIFAIRIGIHSGPVVAGIVGSKKFQYDIWGDTVNMAARMEQHSEKGKINISQATYQLVSSNFECVHRGKVKAKNKGEIDMYFVGEVGGGIA
ncbi:MAG TPA: adenylate/guanylate cyclase domain-containing protein [Haliscomenobacter sp.]|uniref:adenylate/guanylate cyclase domain-containing protein n=1 Tax=Haliscomenobacter sp. TaxID=2717303 RepID=UPI002BF8BF7E|nr:adenylate/guanylate cyclase domain-containing protein [Haliscomenobacter sp.]HOY20555.1 adenylate/guanylate cyclase domain-containing protein [Haliscomenobacter sp.]